MKEFLESEEFYNAMQLYRHADMLDQHNVWTRYEYVKQLILDNCETAEVNESNQHNEQSLVEFDKLEQKLTEAKSRIVMEFSGDEIPEFYQGEDQHELLEVVTAERCRYFVSEIENLRKQQDSFTVPIELLMLAAESVCKSLEHPTESVSALQMWKLREALSIQIENLEVKP